MFDNQLLNRPERGPFVSFLIVIIVVGLGFIVVGPLVGFMLALPFYDGSVMEMVDALENPSDPAIKIPYYIVQGTSTFIGLIVGPALFLSSERRSYKTLLSGQSFSALPYVITFLIVIVFMAVNSVFVEWNSNLVFPEFLSEFEQWARRTEKLAEKVTKFLTVFDSEAQLLVAIFVIAVLPAIGEEFVFRGIIQNQLYKASSNIHVAIWISAIIFSAIHLQFFGFVPRMLLGALFGYLYYWSGNLWVAIFAHFVNNGMSVLAMYFYQKGLLDVDMESTDAVPLPMFLVSCAITIGLLYYFHKQYSSRQSFINPL